jgi:sodium transport system ATP-binding protein
MIEVSGISKRFGAVQALDGVSFSARDGRITGLLGPNGAGKSTCLRILYTVLRPDTGTATINGIDVREHPLLARRQLGVLPHGAGLYPQLTTRENIAYFGRLHGLAEAELTARIDDLIARLELGEIADRRAKGFSQGERTKVALARALVHAPEHLLLDEPTNGLDVMATVALRRWLEELRAAGLCIVL